MLFGPIKPDMAARLAAVNAKMRAVALASGDPRSLVFQAVSHHLQTPGQRVRSQIALHTADCLGVDTQSALAMATCCELLHDASLIHDDLQDQDHLRRGAQAVWSLFGADVAVCAGDLLLSAAYAALTEVTDLAVLPRLISMTHLAVAQTIRGQVAAVSPHRKNEGVAIYSAMAAAKSGPLLNLPFAMVVSYCHRPDDAEVAARAVRAFAIAYQIADDLEDIEADELNAPDVASNIIIVLETAKDCNRAAAQAAAVRMAHGKLAETVAIAAALPLGTGAILSDLAQRITDKLDGYQ